MEGPLPGEEVTGEKVFRPGIRLNVGSALHNYQNRFYKGKTIFATSAGLLASIRISKLLNIQPEVLYETKGSKHQDGVFRTHSVTAPLNIRIMSPDDNMRTYFMAGGYYSFHFGGNISGTPIDYENSFNEQEFGFTVGAGFEIMGKVQMGICFQTGLSDLNQLPDDRISHENIYFSLGYLF
jgi:hypothetical protein